MIYDYDKEKSKNGVARKVIIGIVTFLIIIAAVIANNIYLEIAQLKEIGSFLPSIYLKNLMYKFIFSGIAFLLIFISITLTNIFVKRNMHRFYLENNLPQKNLPNFIISLVFSLIGALFSKDFFYQKALNFLNSSNFADKDPLFSLNIGYYVFERPFYMAVYNYISSLWMFVILFTVAYYLFSFFITFNNLNLQDLKVKGILRHNLINIAIFFLIKATSYKFKKEGILFSDVVGVKGASYVDVNIWQKYFEIIPFVIILIVALALVFMWKGKLRKSAYTIAAFPIIAILVGICAFAFQSFIIGPNPLIYEGTYLANNMKNTRNAYNITSISNKPFPAIKELTSDILKKNVDTINNIRIVDYQATLDSNTQLQSIKNFYTFNNGDIINYKINGKDIPIFITAREINKNNIPDRTYVKDMFMYTHGYGVVINPINKLTSEGQVDFILSGLDMKSADQSIKINEPRIYYGEVTQDHVIVNPSNSNKIKEIDYDGNSTTSYSGTGGIKLDFINRLLFALRYGDLNMIISTNISSDSKLLLNRDIISRAQKAVPFLTIDTDPYIIPTADGRLKWVLDAYTTTNNYPYSQDYGNFNYIRNSVKIIIDAYDGSVKYYVIDKNDPIIQTYIKSYPGVFSEESMPADITQHMRYPEALFKIQTNVLKRYHLDPQADSENVSKFFSNQDLWEIAQFPKQGTSKDASNPDTSMANDIDPYYNMIKLPSDIGKNEELILMRPFTPSGGRHNMVSWLAVRNSSENYGQMILFNFPKDTNILGTDQVEVNINQIKEVSESMTLLGQRGSKVFKGNLLVIPIEDSVLYVEPIYIKSEGESSIPQVRKVVVGYQKDNDFKSGVGDNLDSALKALFKDFGVTPQVPNTSDNTVKPANEKLINDISSKYDELKKQIDDLGKMLGELKGK